MTDSPNKVIGAINSMQTLIEHIPSWLFPISVQSVSPINFIIDVLHQLGITDFELIDNIVNLFFNVQNAVEKYMNTPYVYKRLNNPTDEQKQYAEELPELPEPGYNTYDYVVVNGVYYYKTTKIIFNEQSPFLNGIEKETKGLIMNILSGLLSCSIIPRIPDDYFDNNPDILPKTIPINVIDTSNLLSICPTTEIGKNFYSVDEDMTPNTLYKSNDMNAMLWYEINRGTLINQSERNKLMWDSRLIEKDFEDYYRDSAEKWNQWLASKSGWDGLFSVSGKTEQYEQYYESGKTENLPLHPILQLYPSNIIGDSISVNYHISHQTFSGKTIYDFNTDYLENIQIFNPRHIIANMINNLLNGNVINSLNIELSLQNRIIDEQINRLIAKAIEVDDENISDCFFTFSNDELNEMIAEMETQRYSGKYLNSETSPVIKINEGYGLELLNQINSTATINEKLETLTRSVYEVSTIPETDEAIRISDKNSIGYNSKWLNDIIMAIVRPMIKSILSPKVMLLFVINFDMMGLINLDDINTLDDVMKLFYRKIMGAIFSIIKYIKDKIIQYLLNLFLQKVKPLIDEYTLWLITEKLRSWKDLLVEASLCVVPVPFIPFNKNLTQIDNVRYADITQEQTEPESTNKC